VAQWTHKQYDLLESAITGGTRISAYRRGTEYVVVPTTGDQITIYLDELDSFEVVK
jgi:hypothetical protein